jgi:hypothetical protein
MVLFLTNLVFLGSSRALTPTPTPFAPTACEICEAGREYSLLVHQIYRGRLDAGEMSMRSWCNHSYGNESERCEGIAADHYENFVKSFRARVPMHRICAKLDYCRHPGKVFNYRSRTAGVVIGREPTDDLYRYLENARDEEELTQRLATPPDEVAVLASMIPQSDIPLIMVLLDHGSRSGFGWYFRDRAR